MTKIIRTKLLPRTNSTDSWTTDGANQTYQTNWGAASYSSQFNTWVDARLADTSVDAVVDANALRAADPLKFVVNGTANYATNDGTHPSPTTHELLAVELRAKIAAIS